MKRFLIIIVAVFGFYIQNLSAQSSYIDSLENELYLTKSDSLKIDLLHKLSSAHADSSYTKSLSYLKQALVIANSSKDRPQMALIHQKMGLFLFNRGEFNFALREFKNALTIYELVNDTNSVGESYNDIGLVYKNWGKYEDALDAFLKGLAIFEGTGNEEGVAMVVHNMGQIYYYRADYLKAITYFKKYLILNEKTGNKRAVAGAANNIAAAYMELKKYDLALENYFKALEIYDSLDVQIGVGILSDNIGMLYALTQNYAVSISYHQRARAIFEKMNSKSRLSYALKNLGYSHCKLGNYHQSVEYLLKSKELVINNPQPELEKEIYYHLSASYEALNQTGEALRYYKLMDNIKDSLLNFETKRSLDAKEREFGASKTEREYNFLQKKMEQQSIYKNILGIIAFLFLLILSVLLIDNIVKAKYIRKDKQRNSLIMKTLNRTLNSFNENSKIDFNENVRIITSSSVQSESNSETINICTAGFTIITTIFSASVNENILIAKSFLYNEIMSFVKSTPKLHTKQIVDLINSKLQYINSLFDVKQNKIWKNIFVFNSHNQQAICAGKSKFVWHSNQNYFTDIKSNQQINPQPQKGKHHSVLYMISQIDTQSNLGEFVDVFEKTVAGILDMSFTNKTEVLNSAIESAKLSGQLDTSIVLTVVNVDENKPLDIILLD